MIDEDKELIILSAEDFDAFLALLAAPAAPTPELVELLQRKAPWEPGSEPSEREP